MAPNSSLQTEIVMILLVLLSFATNIGSVYALKYLGGKEPCYRPYCYNFLQTNKSNVITIKANETTGRTVFCYEGLQQSLIHVWSNPVLRIVKQLTSQPDEVVKFVSFYGSSVAEAEQRSDAAVNAMLQNWMSSVQSVKHSEDISLSAFNNSCVLIESNVDYKARVELKVIDFWFIIYLATGIIIFFSAKTWSRNVSLHYGTGVSVGVLASVLILLYILSRFLPQKLKTVCYILMAMGTSASIWALQSITEIVSDATLNKLHLYWHYVLAYLIIMGLLSFAVVYRYGPVTDPRTLNLIQWLLQCIGLILIYNGTQIREVSVALIIITLTVYNFPRFLITRLLDNQSSRNLWYRFFRPKIKLLTEEEYIQQGNVHTREELERLRDYCRSPDCKAWRVIGRLSSPHRFAEFITNGSWHVSEQEEVQHARDLNPRPADEDAHSDTHSDAESELTFADFVEGNSWHVTNDELLEYDSGPDPAPPHLVSDDEDPDNEDDDIDFMLSSP